MQDDLLRFVSGPMPYSTAWLWWGLLLLLGVSAWCAGVFVWTLPSERLRRLPVARTVHARLLRRRFARAVRRITARHRAGELTAAEAAAAMSRTLRSFLHQATGIRAQYLHLDAIAAGELAAAAPVLAALDDAQFNAGSPVAVTDVGAETEELIRSWP
ncbi:Uncharacterised protein [Mycolicibacterium phlei]|uniref:DUF4381 domain-containing protein n=1 Tax=Mycolicibacterium phlei DSM 43239 = CCUG 21000 TaxID=1226750 RepID=A0A5N5VGF1_MYCPH|nr:hypothetical protein [Mycolicibacterium phlei]VEG11344.1 Uncharacterised protein [Mycobacteroides chelonae]AMO63247.1 hypothetical protein MPHLCCUG_04461 [Mycolicibacterium phlei]EID16130.1 hypothetical protein MPHLEI_06622 [Mycolicibacterium phlei RIVM601174]KAB7759887.1 hypothetical protein MPHL21000_02350 [Mycolicibacterium phlei DSM 43239 = CCUG 21000]KXW64254.1 hypothetical protein MPHL43072_06710 [Mycolicibacterium phlei DSM 43072]